MSTLIFLFFEIGSFFMLAFLLHKCLLHYNKAVVIVGYFSLLWLIAEVFNQIHIWLRNRDVFIELGHASLLGILILFLFHIIGIAVILWNVSKTKKT